MISDYIAIRTRPANDQRGSLSIADYVLYGEFHHAAAALQVRHNMAAGINSYGPDSVGFFVGAIHHALTAPRAIVPRDMYREYRRLRRLRRAATWLYPHPHRVVVQYRYSYQSPRQPGARPIRNWIDNTSYSPSTPIPLPAPQIAGLLPARVPAPQPAITWIPVPAMAGELPPPPNYYPKPIPS